MLSVLTNHQQDSRVLQLCITRGSITAAGPRWSESLQACGLCDPHAAGRRVPRLGLHGVSVVHPPVTWSLSNARGCCGRRASTWRCTRTRPRSRRPTAAPTSTRRPSAARCGPQAPAARPPLLSCALCLISPSFMYLRLARPSSLALCLVLPSFVHHLTRLSAVHAVLDLFGQCWDLCMCPHSLSVSQHAALGRCGKRVSLSLAC